ncbi:MAG TPA: endo-1,4-beta-xylanase [Pirellulales bacterium]|jgi:hypothetical protein
MGQLHFLVPPPHRVLPQAIQSAHICGRDYLPFVSRVTYSPNGELTIDREEDESGTFHILWPTASHGNLLLSTATLVERPEPYLLPLELARGTLHRLRNFLAEWQATGMTIPPAVNGHLSESLHCFVKAVAQQRSPPASAELAGRSIDAALAGIDGISAALVEQARRLRQQQMSRVLPLFAGRLGDSVPDVTMASPFLAAFNTAAIPFSWSGVEADEGRQNWSLTDAQVQWCQSHNLRICGGPLLELRRRSLPDWIYLWEGDFDNLLMVAGDYIRSVVTRYRGKVHFWNAAGRLISGEALKLDEEQKLRLAIRAVEVIRSLDPNTPVIVSIDQPWAEFMSRHDAELNPLQLADTLVRSDLGLSGIGMEINLGASADATLPRDLLEFNAQIDMWSSLGLPMLVSVAVPSAANDLALQSQQAWLESYLPVLLARPTVQAVIWNQLFDSEADDFPHTGLIDSQRHLKPAFSSLAALRRQYSA